MDSSWLLMITLRRLFGFVIPGFVWIVILPLFNAPLFQRAATAVVSTWGEVTAGMLLLVASYIAGIVGTGLFFRPLGLAGDWIDRQTSRTVQPWLRRSIAWLTRTFNILSISTLEQDAERLNAALVGDSLSSFSDSLIPPG